MIRHYVIHLIICHYMMHPAICDSLWVTYIPRLLCLIYVFVFNNVMDKVIDHVSNCVQGLEVLFWILPECGVLSFGYYQSVVSSYNISRCGFVMQDARKFIYSLSNYLWLYLHTAACHSKVRIFILLLFSITWANLATNCIYTWWMQIFVISLYCIRHL